MVITVGKIYLINFISIENTTIKYYVTCFYANRWNYIFYNFIQQKNLIKNVLIISRGFSCLKIFCNIIKVISNIKQWIGEVEKTYKSWQIWITFIFHKTSKMNSIVYRKKDKGKFMLFSTNKQKVNAFP